MIGGLNPVVEKYIQIADSRPGVVCEGPSWQRQTLATAYVRASRRAADHGSITCRPQRPRNPLRLAKAVCRAGPPYSEESRPESYDC